MGHIGKIHLLPLIKYIIECDIRTGQRYQLEIYRQAVTALIVNERIEMARHKGMMVGCLHNFIVTSGFVNPNQWLRKGPKC